MKILYIGSSSPLSLIPLQLLINSKYKICAVAVDEDNNSEFNIINSGSISIQSLAFDNSIPLIKLNENFNDMDSKISLFQPDIILVSCYARLIPQSVLSIANVGAFNLHPSLLPLFRGPTPLFWQFREGISDFGVTLHRMNSEFDTGNIISQTKVEMHDGINKVEATKLLANMGGKLILDFLRNVTKNNIHDIAQDNDLSSYQTYPTKDDYTVSTSWIAKRIYNFIKGYKESGVSFLCDVNGTKFELLDALSYQHEPYNNIGSKKFVLENNLITFSCQSGYIQCQVK